MQAIIKSPRNGCGLHGAVQTIEEIRGVVPIVHSNAGCSVQNYLANKASGLGNGYGNGESVFSTAVQERHVIFGGASRLREQIKNVIKVVDGELYIVLNSCESAMVGDDIEAMTREAREQGEAVIECLTAGFHGDSHYGYETVVTDIIEKLPQVKKVSGEKNEKLVNIFGILPQKDIYFKGDLAEIKRILQGIGLEVNVFFGPSEGIEEFKKAPKAALNLVFSKWGRKPAEALQELYNIPNLEFTSVPLGPQEMEVFIDTVAKQLSIEEKVVADFLKKERQEFDYYYQSLSDSFYEEAAGKSIAVVGDESMVIRVAGFLKKYLGINVEIAIITDAFEKEEDLHSLAGKVYFTQDSREIQEILLHNDLELIMGSSLEDAAAEKKNIVNFEISYPVYSKVIANKSYAGNKGALTLIEDYLTAVKAANRLREQQLLQVIYEQ